MFTTLEYCCSQRTFTIVHTFSDSNTCSVEILGFVQDDLETLEKTGMKKTKDLLDLDLDDLVETVSFFSCIDVSQIEMSAHTLP